jgi:sugar O-acyltransferase (sialic acid O-acetyltransferase NeuD family)
VSGPIVVFGAGGHGKVVCDILLASGVEVAGFIDDGKIGARVLGLPVVGGRAWLEGRSARVALGIGDNAARERVAEACLKAGASLVTAIHPRAVVAASATVGEGAVVMALAVVNPDAEIQRGAIVNTGAVIEHDCLVGAFAHVSPGAAMAGACKVHARAHLGIGAAMLPGTAVVAGAVVGGGAVVTRDVAARSVVLGVPAKLRA